jgi:hypothetical protein
MLQAKPRHPLDSQMVTQPQVLCLGRTEKRNPYFEPRLTKNLEELPTKKREEPIF